MVGKTFEGIPGIVHFRVTAIYYPYEGVNSVSDLFHGKSEAEAVQQIRDYLEHCKQRGSGYRRPDYNGKAEDFTEFPRKPKYPEDKVEVDNGDESDTDPEENKNESGSGNVSPKVGRSQHFIGSAWMVHYGKRLKKRVPGAQIQEYLSQGWVRGGPATKV